MLNHVSLSGFVFSTVFNSLGFYFGKDAKSTKEVKAGESWSFCWFAFSLHLCI